MNTSGERFGSSHEPLSLRQPPIHTTRIDESTSSDHALSPPRRLRTFLRPPSISIRAPVRPLPRSAVHDDSVIGGDFIIRSVSSASEMRRALVSQVAYGPFPRFSNIKKEWRHFLQEGARPLGTISSTLSTSVSNASTTSSPDSDFTPQKTS